MNTSKIEWTEATWSPVIGCTKVSAGCKHCYAEREVETRWSKNPKSIWYGRSFTDVLCRMEAIAGAGSPLRWRKPRQIFVCPRADLFHDAVSFEFIAAVFGAMSHARQHTFQVLTKRPARMLEFFDWLGRQRRHKAGWVAQVNHAEFICGEPAGTRGSESTPVEVMAIFAHYDRVAIAAGKRSHGSYSRNWPLPNVHLGVSIEDQATADERIPLLLNTPAAMRWVSAEPLLWPVNLRPHLDWSFANADMSRSDVNWVVVGGESGLHARPMHPDWARSLRDQCEAAGVPFLFKHWGEWAPAADGDRCISRYGTNMPNIEPHGSNGIGTTRIRRVGKRAAGRLLDGVLHDAYPEVRS